MRRARDELRFEAIELTQVCHVLEEDDGACQLALAVAHRRRPLPERTLDAVDDQWHDGAGLLAGDRLLRFEDVRDRHRHARVLGDVDERLAEHRAGRTEKRFGGAVDPLHAAGTIRDDDRIVQRIYRGHGGLLRDETSFPRSDWRSSRIRAAIALKPAASTPISSVARTSTVASRSPAAIRLTASVTCRTGRTMRFDRKSAYQLPHSTSVSARPSVVRNQRRARRGGLSGFPPHGVLVEVQQPVALRSQERGEWLELCKVLAPDALGRTFGAGQTSLCVAEESIELAIVLITLRAHGVKEFGFSRLGDIADRALVRGIEAEPMLLYLWDGSGPLAEQHEHRG